MLPRKMIKLYIGIVLQVKTLDVVCQPLSGLFQARCVPASRRRARGLRPAPLTSRGRGHPALIPDASGL